MRALELDRPPTAPADLLDRYDRRRRTIAVEDSASIDRGKCLGCGLCASECPTEAISLVLRPDREEPFDRITEMGIEVLRRKQANAEKAT